LQYAIVSFIAISFAIPYIRDGPNNKCVSGMSDKFFMSQDNNFHISKNKHIYYKDLFIKSFILKEIQIFLII